MPIYDKNKIKAFSMQIIKNNYAFKKNKLKLDPLYLYHSTYKR